MAVTITGKEILGGPCFVAAGLAGSGTTFVDIGLVPNVSIKLELFAQVLQNEVGQKLPDSVWSLLKGGMVELSMRNVNAVQMKQLITSVATYDVNSIGFETDIQTIEPITLHIRPAQGLGMSSFDFGYWITGACCKDIGNFIHKVDDNDASQEDFTLQFEMFRIINDYSAASQDIDVDGQVFFRGTSDKYVTTGWESDLPRGYLPTTPLAPSSIASRNVSANGFTVDWGIPQDRGSGLITGYTIEWRLSSSTGAYTTATTTASTRTYAITGLTTGTSYAVRVAAVNSVGTGAYLTLTQTTS